MYENNTNNYNYQQNYPQQPQYNFSTDPNRQSKPPKKKRSSGAIALIIAGVIVVGGASGFGGAYLASKTNTSESSSVNSENSGASENEPAYTTAADSSATTAAETVPQDAKPDYQVSDDLISLKNTVAINTSVEYDYEELYEKVNGSIVIVRNYISDNDGSYSLYGTGSGVIFTTDGYIITNAHVVSGATKVSVVVSDQYSDEEEMEAVLLGSDTSTDVAVLKVKRDEPFTAAALGDSDSLKIGQRVAAIGNPAGLSKTLTDGIVSGLNRTAYSNGYELSSIQTNAAINPGNSGGGLFDMYGNVIGIVNSKLVSQSSDTSVENLGFAISINEAKPIISDLINYGYVTGRPALGITTKAINSVYAAQMYGLSSTGLLVTEINSNAPVAKSGLQVGDVITHINGTEVTSVTDVQTIIKDMAAGDTVTATVSRTSTSDTQFFSHTTSETLEIEIELTESGSY